MTNPKLLLHRKTPKGVISFTPNNFDAHDHYQPPLHIHRAREAFFEHTIRDAVGDPMEICLIWTGRMRQSTPIFTHKKLVITARRFIYLLMHGPLNPGDRVRSLCKNPRCVSVFHVERIPSRQPVPTTLRTSLNWREKNEARSLLRKQVHTLAVAKRFNVAPSVLQPLIEEIVHAEAPKVVRGHKRATIERMHQSGYKPEEIVREVYVNLASVMSVINEFDMARLLKRGGDGRSL